MLQKNLIPCAFSRTSKSVTIILALYTLLAKTFSFDRSSLAPVRCSSESIFRMAHMPEMNFCNVLAPVFQCYTGVELKHLKKTIAGKDCLILTRPLWCPHRVLASICLERLSSHQRLSIALLGPAGVALKYLKKVPSTSKH